MKALVLSGGGAKGAFQVGALNHILGDLKKSYDLFVGISVGALNSSFLAMYPTGQETEAVQSLNRIWFSVNDSKIFHQRYPSLRSSVSMTVSAFKARSVYDSQPLIDLINKTLKPEMFLSSGKRLLVGAVAVKTGELRYWGEQSKDIAAAVAASSAFPGFFNPIEIDNMLWLDGGIRTVVPVVPALKAGASEVDVIATSPNGLNAIDTSKLTVVSAAPRIIDIMSEEIMDNDVRFGKLLAEHLGATIRVLRPEYPILSNPLNFNQSKIQENIRYGYDLAKKVSWL